MANKVVSFSGHSYGTDLAAPQLIAFNAQLGIIMAAHTITAFHHSDRGDSEYTVHNILRLLVIPIRIHPVECHSLRAHSYAKTSYGTQYKRLLPKYKRRALIDGCDIIIVCVESDVETKNSTAWADIRYATLKSKTIIRIDPDGTVH